MANKGREKREFERYPASLKVHILAMDPSGEHFSEEGILRNISGGGANLLASEPERFFVGQKVDLNIHLPEEDDLSARMKGHGTVVWVGEEENPEDHSIYASIGLCLDDLLSFEHLISRNAVDDG